MNSKDLYQHNQKYYSFFFIYFLITIYSGSFHNSNLLFLSSNQQYQNVHHLPYFHTLDLKINQIDFISKFDFLFFNNYQNTIDLDPKLFIMLIKYFNLIQFYQLSFLFIFLSITLFQFFFSNSFQFHFINFIKIIHS